MKTDQSRVQSLLRDTITLLCRNSLNFTRELKVQGLLGITMDDNSIFIVHIDESFKAGFDGMCTTKNEADYVDYGEMELVESITRGSLDVRKGMARGSSRIRNTHRKDAQLELQVDSGEKYRNDFVTNGVDFVGDSAEPTVFENHVRVSAIKSEFSCGDEDVKLFQMESTDSKQTEGLWGSQRSHDSVVKSNAIKNEPYSAADCGQFMTGGPDLAIVIPDEDFDEMDELFAGGLDDDLGYAADQDQSGHHVLNDSDAGFRTRIARPVKVAPPAYDRHHTKLSNASSFQCLPRSVRTLGRSSFNSSNVWKNNKKPQKPHRFQPNSLILTKSFHICGYPDCGKQFFHRRHLLRHQTQKHGRVPTRVLHSPRKVWTDLESIQDDADECQVKDFIDYCTNSTNE